MTTSNSSSAAHRRLKAVAGWLFSRHWLQFSLRTLFLFTAAVAVVLAWWLRPYEVQVNEPGVYDLPMTGVYTLRRTLLGGEEAYGPQRRQYEYGFEIRWTQWSESPDHKSREAIKVEYIRAHGTRVENEVDWSVYFAIERYSSELSAPSVGSARLYFRDAVDDPD